MPYVVPPPGRRITNATLRSMVGEWQTYPVAWSADSGTTTLGNGSLVGRYCVIGGLCQFTVRLEWGSSTTQSVSTANWKFSLPTAPYSGDGSTFQPVEAWIYNADDSGTASRWPARAYVNTSGNIEFIVANASSAVVDSATNPIATGGSTTTLRPGGEAWAIGDRLNLYGSYEIA